MGEPVGLNGDVAGGAVTATTGRMIVSAAVPGDSVTYGSQQPNDGETVTVNDQIFEFDGDGSVRPGSIGVPIGANPTATYQQLAAAITSRTGTIATAGSGILSVPGAALAIGRGVLRLGDPVVPHGTGPHAAATMAEASTRLVVQGKGVCRNGDKATCGHTLAASATQAFTD